MSRSPKKLFITGAVVVLGLALAGCASGAQPTTSPSPTASPTESPTPTPSPTQTDPNAPTGQCADDALEVTIESDGAGAGSLDYSVVFTNTGDAACELRGAPGVSVIDDAGTQLGQPAEQEGDDAPQTLTVEPGASVMAPLQAVNIDPDGGPLDDCPVTYGTAWRVYPPHSFSAFDVTAADRLPACDSGTVWLSVGPVQQ
jgi:hypothetical protein